MSGPVDPFSCLERRGTEILDSHAFASACGVVESTDGEGALDRWSQGLDEGGGRTAVELAQIIVDCMPSGVLTSWC